MCRHFRSGTHQCMSCQPMNGLNCAGTSTVPVGLDRDQCRDGSWAFAASLLDGSLMWDVVVTIWRRNSVNSKVQYRYLPLPLLSISPLMFLIKYILERCLLYFIHNSLILLNLFIYCALNFVSFIDSFIHRF